MKLTEAFKSYGATLKNVNWSVSAENDKGELVLSLWKQYFRNPENGVIRYVDKVSRWHGNGNGNKEFISRVEIAFPKHQKIRAVIARTDDEEAVSRGEDASKLKNTFHVRVDWIGKITVWDGDNIEIEFRAIDT